MIEVKLNRGRFKLEPEQAIKSLKKKLQKEGVLQEMRARQWFMSKGRKAYLARRSFKHRVEMANLASKGAGKR